MANSLLNELLQRGLSEQRAGRFFEAAAIYREMLQHAPDHPLPIHFLGFVLHQMGIGEEGLELLRRSTELEPNFGPFHFNLGKCLREQRRTDEAIAALQRAVKLPQTPADAWVDLGYALRDQARLDEAIAVFREAIKGPSAAAAWDGLLYTLWFQPNFDVQNILKEHRTWAARVADPLGRGAAPHDNDRDPDRRLRIGYVSAEFRDHVVGRYFRPIIEAHDRERFEIICYSDLPREDAVGEHIRSRASQWKRTVALPHDQLAQLVRSDRIDVFVDLANHTGMNRLLAFARKPAPVQVSYLGYPATTGLAAIEYRVTTAHLEPAYTDDHGPEKLIRLPDTYWAYPAAGDSPAVNDLPGQRNGFITFASLNNVMKTNPPLVRTWSRILDAVPNSKLKINASGGADVNRGLLPLFHDNGISPDRLEIVGYRPFTDFQKYFHDIDVSLDPFPYNGGATSLDSLWMGVPIVTVAGHCGVARAGTSLLMNLNLRELIAGNPDEYVSIAVELARDLPRLTDLRATLRERMRGSPLCDAPKLTRHLEDAYRKIWRNWCDGQPPRDLNL